jgi:hypothetical protein
VGSSFAKVQPRAVLGAFALLERVQHTGVVSLQRLNQGVLGLVPARDVSGCVAHGLGQGGAVQARFAAKVIADGADVGACGLGQFTRGGLGKPLLGKQAQRLLQQL